MYLLKSKSGGCANEEAEDPEFVPPDDLTASCPDKASSCGFVVMIPKLA